ncbi:MAG TPA: MotA/TolQ/ExbB proton channel family protein [Myxococcota bacterium]|jgi:biopolymer transport protein ExbB
MDQALDYFARGGPVMVVLLIASILSLAIFIERMIALRSGRVAPKELLHEAEELVRAGKIAEALARCVGSGTPAGAVFAAVLKKPDATEAAQKEAAQEVGRREAVRLERFAEAIGVIAALGPLLGLLGTVLGMIKVFQRVNEVGAGSPVEMAAGIWEALLATAAGLLVGIPALVMYRIILARADTLVLRLEEGALSLVDMLRPKS